jgi:hypothetical protein
VPNTVLSIDTPARADHATLFVSLELGAKKWLVTSLSPGGDRMSKIERSASSGLPVASVDSARSCGRATAQPRRGSRTGSRQDRHGGRGTTLLPER